MSASLRIWLGLSHHESFRVGGWAFVRDDAGAISGVAGGARQLDAQACALSGLIAALKDAKGATLFTASPFIAGLPARIAEAAADPAKAPDANLALWAQASTLLAGVTVVRGTADRNTPLAFAAAWAELGRDKAKDRGPFTSAIPKPNLAKAGVPAT